MIPEKDKQIFPPSADRAVCAWHRLYGVLLRAPRPRPTATTNTNILFANTTKTACQRPRHYSVVLIGHKHVPCDVFGTLQEELPEQTPETCDE